MQNKYVNASDRRKLIPLKEMAVSHFQAENWLELGLLTGSLDLVQRHERLLRSLRFNDDDYPGAALAVLMAIVEREAANLEFIEEYIQGKFGDADGENVSTSVSTGRRIFFVPSVFQVPDSGVDENLVAVMMPFAAEFEPVFEAIQHGCSKSGLRCIRVKDIWEHQTIIQDVFSLIFRATYVVCDYSGRNANVFYEAGIAHTLGKHVIGLAQSPADVPFDISHHRYLSYLNNGEGREKMANELSSRLTYLRMPPDLRELLG